MNYWVFGDNYDLNETENEKQEQCVFLLEGESTRCGVIQVLNSVPPNEKEMHLFETLFCKDRIFLRCPFYQGMKELMEERGVSLDILNRMFWHYRTPQ